MTRSINIFRAGTHTDSRGYAHTFTQADLEDVVNTFNPQHSKVPLVRGHNHPADDSEAEGWTTSVWCEEGDLWAEVEPTSEFEQKLADKRFANVSASFYLPASPANPYPGKLALRHIGFVLTPAIKGLQEFNEVVEDIVNFSMTIDTPNIAELAEVRLAEIEDNLELLDVEYSEEVDDAIATKLANEITEFVERKAKVPAPESQPTEAETKLNLEVERLRKQVEDQRKAMRTKELTQFAEKMYSDGKLTPAAISQESLIEFMSALDDDTVLSFSETSVLDTFKSLLSGLPAVVSYAEVMPNVQAEAAKTYESYGYGVDPKSVDTHHKALSYAEKHGCDYVTALKAII